MEKFTYEVLENGVIKRISEDGKEWFIPKDEGNADYQAYLRWLENPTDTGWTEPTLTKF